MVLATSLYLLPSLRCVSAGARGLGAKTQALGDRPGERTGVDCAETAKMYWSMAQATRSEQDNAWVHHRSPTGNVLMKGGSGPHHSSLILFVLTVGTTLDSMSSASRQALMVAYTQRWG